MENNISQNGNSYECRSVEVLTSDITGQILGYCVGGSHPGPNLLVSGYGPMMNELFEKLTEIPTLPWMWGKLYLISLNALDAEHDGNPLATLQDVIFDETLLLPQSDPATGDAITSLESYKTVLRMCAGMGMITGRGVSSEP